MQQHGAAASETAVVPGRSDDLPEHGPQVQAVAEVVTGAGDHYGANAVVGVQRGEHQRNLPPEVRAHGIALARADKRDLNDRAATLDL